MASTALKNQVPERRIMRSAKDVRARFIVGAEMVATNHVLPAASGPRTVVEVNGNGYWFTRPQVSGRFWHQFPRTANLFRIDGPNAVTFIDKGGASVVTLRFEPEHHGYDCPRGHTRSREEFKAGGCGQCGVDRNGAPTRKDDKPVLRLWIRLDVVGADARTHGYNLLNKVLDGGALQESFGEFSLDDDREIRVDQVVCATDPGDL